MTRPLIIAHRGTPGRRENTLAGFLDGIARGAEWIELDLHQTADGALVVHHEFTLGGKPLARCTLREARGRARRLKRIELPTLDEVLEAVPGHIGLNVEIKAAGIGKAVVSCLARYQAADRTLISSFHFPTVRELAGLRPRVRGGILSASRLLDPVREIRRARAQALCQEYLVVDRELVRAVKRAGFEFYVWTVNRKEDLRRMLALQVDGIITDHPDRLLRLRRPRRKVSL